MHKTDFLESFWFPFVMIWTCLEWYETVWNNWDFWDMIGKYLVVQEVKGKGHGSVFLVLFFESLQVHVFEHVDFLLFSKNF